MPYGHLSRDELLDLLRTRDLARADERKRREQIRLELLAQAAPFLAQPIEYEEKLEAITRLVVPRVADFSSIDLVEGGMLRKVVAYHPRRSKQRALDRLVHRPPGPIPDSVRLVLETAKARRRDLAPDLSAGRIRDQTCLEVLQQLGVGWTILAPLVAHRRVVGILCLAMAESGRRYDDADVALAKEIARHTSFAIESARRYRSARTAVAARDNVLSVVLHELLNYLGAIRMGASLLTAAEPANTTGPAKTIRLAATGMEELIHSLREATMIEGGELPVSEMTESVSSLIEGAVTIHRPVAHSRGLDLRGNLPSPDLVVSCDRTRVMQVFSNLINNSIKVTPPGGRISIEAKAIGSTVCCAVSDTGRGMSEKRIAQLFDANPHIRRQTSRAHGLGLFIAKGIVAAHGGRIWADSRPGKGTTVYFTLPSAEHREGVPAEAEARGGRHAGKNA